MARRELIARLTPVNERGLTDRRSFLKALKQVRKDGYAAAVGDVTFGAAAVAAPVFNQAGGVEAVVSLRGPEARMSAERIRMIAPLVVETADVISRDFFGPPVRRSTV